MPGSLLKLTMTMLAIAAPYAALTVAAPPGSAAAPPFGWRHLVLVYVLCWLSFTWIAISLVSASLPALTRRGAASVWLVIGLALCAGSAVAGSAIHDGLQAAGLSPWGARMLWCFILQLPWCAAALSLTRDERTAPQAPPLGLLALALAVALALPRAYEDDLIGKQTALANRLFDEGRLRDAEPVAFALADMGSTVPIGGQNPRQAQTMITATLAQLASEVMQPLPANATAEHILTRGKQWGSLGEPQEGRSVVRELAETDAEAALVMAVLFQDEQVWSESNRWYRKALALLGEKPSNKAVSARTRAYEGLAFNAREVGDYQAAEQVYREALRSVPTAAANFHFQLGRHYRLGGRPWDAVSEFDMAARIDPAQYAEQSQAMIDAVQLDTPMCLFAPPPRFERQTGAAPTR